MVKVGWLSFEALLLAHRASEGPVRPDSGSEIPGLICSGQTLDLESQEPPKAHYAHPRDSDAYTGPHARRENIRFDHAILLKQHTLPNLFLFQLALIGLQAEKSQRNNRKCLQVSLRRSGVSFTPISLQLFISCHPVSLSPQSHAFAPLTHAQTPVVAALNPLDETGGTSLTISLPPSSTLLSDCHQGDSIAVNGVCLTVVTFTTEPAPSFTVGVAPETLRITNLGSLTRDSRCNLERAVRADTRMGGHFVQGHVDTTATIARMEPDGNAMTIRFQPTKREVLRYVVYKGFIALDGTSLTVTKVDDAEGWWEVMLIAYTQEKVVIAQKKVGDTVNVEVDMMAKYAEKSMLWMSEGGSLPFLKEIEKTVEKIVAQGLGARPT